MSVAQLTDAQLLDLALTVVLVAANVLGGAMAFPQMLKLRRVRRVDGISPAWAGCSAAVNAWWAAYGLGTGDVGIVPVSVVSVVAYLSIAVALVRLGGAPRRTAAVIGASAIAIGAVPFAALGVGGWTAAGLALGGLYGIQLSPAVIAVYRSVDVSGVSLGTWSMALVEAVLWGCYGLARADVGLLALAATGTLMSALVLARVLVRRPRRRSGVAPAWGETLAAA